MILYAIKDKHTRKLLVDEQCEGNNEKGIPMLFSTKALADMACEDLGITNDSKLVKVKLKMI